MGRHAGTLERDVQIFALADSKKIVEIAEQFGISSQRVNQILSPDKVAARQAITEAVASGAMVIPETCQGCGEAKRIEAHHPDYSKPLEVVWLCRPCHSKRHRVPVFFEPVPAIDKPPRPNKSKPVPTRFEPDELRTLTAYAAESRRTVSFIIREAVREKLAGWTPKS